MYIKKCNYILITQSHSPSTYSYSFNSILHIPVTIFKDLGLIFSSDLFFNNHIDLI